MVWKLLVVRKDINVSGKKLLQCSANATWLGVGRAPCTPRIRKKEQEVFVSHQLPAPACDLALRKKSRKPAPKTQGHVRAWSLIYALKYVKDHTNESVTKWHRSGKLTQGQNLYSECFPSFNALKALCGQHVTSSQTLNSKQGRSSSAVALAWVWACALWLNI